MSCSAADWAEDVVDSSPRPLSRSKSSEALLRLLVLPAAVATVLLFDSTVDVSMDDADDLDDCERFWRRCRGWLSASRALDFADRRFIVLLMLLWSP